MKKLSILLSTAAASLLVACSSTPVVLAPVGPEPLRETVAGPEGMLKVYTATTTREIGEDTYYYPHTGYQIYNHEGKLVRYVANHTGAMDEEPMTVRLPVGEYKVQATAEGLGRVTVPVVIQASQLTSVNLQVSGVEQKKVTDESAVVRLPNGAVAGWRAKEPSVAKQ